MRHLVVIAAAAALLWASTAPAAEKIGKRTDAPEQLFAGIGEGTSDAELAREVEAASAHPLGTLENPVRVGGPEGERAYLGRLRCADGKPPQAFDRKSGSVGAFGSVVGLYTLDCGAAAPGRSQIAMDMYHEEHREERAPAGFTITR